MKARTKCFFAGLFVVGFSALGITVMARTGATKPNWAVKVNETRGPVRAADMSPLGKTASSEILAGPTNGSDAGYLILTRMPAGARGPALFTLPDDHLYLVLEGKMNVQIGTDKFVAEKNTAVVVPPGIPHEVWNADAQPEVHFEVIAPGSSRDLMSMLKPATPRKVENAAQYINTSKLPAQSELKPGLNGVTFAERKTGTNEQMRIDSTVPGQGGPKPHVHKFQQVYFSIEGQTTVSYGLFTYQLPKYSIAVIQPGVVHTNSNKTSAMERHITLLMPEPKDRSEPFDIEFEQKGPAGPSTPTTAR
jgi:mannose-6-phosphate isomerase-like protein (cupin superfamily)